MFFDGRQLVKDLPAKTCRISETRSSMKNVMTMDQIQTVCVVIAAEMSGNPNPFNYP